MQYSERESIVNKIIAGCTACVFDDIPVFVHEPSPQDKVKAHSIYLTEYKNSLTNGLIKEEELIEELIKRGVWSKTHQEELDKLPKAIEELKVELYNYYFQFKKRDGIRKSLDSLKEIEVKLSSKRDQYNANTCEGFAISCKNKHLICSSTKNADGSKFFTMNYEYYKQEDIDLFIQDYFRQKVNEGLIRDLSKHEPWRSIWSAGKHEGSIFGVPSSLLSQEQRMLIIWSKIYDSIHESPDCPPEEVLEEDDCLDGWMIAQSRKREQERKSEHGYKPGDKFGKHDEVFMVVENPEDKSRVDAMNSPAAIFRKQQRMSALQANNGILPDQYMPDAQQAMRQELVRMQKDRGKK